MNGFKASASADELIILTWRLQFNKFNANRHWQRKGTQNKILFETKYSRFFRRNSSFYISESANYSFIGNLVKSGTSSIAIAAPTKDI